MAQELSQAASRAHAQGDHERTHEAAQVLVESFPETSFAQRVAPHIDRIRMASLHQGRARKWSYTDLKSSGWGGITQASIASEPSPLAPEAPPAHLVVRASSHQAHNAVFLVPGMRLSEECFASSGCLVGVAAGSDGSRVSYRIVPDKGQEGWWRFSDHARIASEILGPHEIRVFLPGVSSDPVVFESQGLDKSRLLHTARSQQ